METAASPIKDLDDLLDQFEDGVERLSTDDNGVKLGIIIPVAIAGAVAAGLAIWWAFKNE